jgi:hypothetical protein
MHIPLESPKHFHKLLILKRNNALNSFIIGNEHYSEVETSVVDISEQTLKTVILN